MWCPPGKRVPCLACKSTRSSAKWSVWFIDSTWIKTLFLKLHQLVIKFISGKYGIFFYGTYETASLKASEIWPFNEENASKYVVFLKKKIKLLLLNHSTQICHWKSVEKKGLLRGHGAGKQKHSSSNRGLDKLCLDPQHSRDRPCVGRLGGSTLSSSKVEVQPIHTGSAEEAGETRLHIISSIQQCLICILNIVPSHPL